MRFGDCRLLRISELYHLKTFCERFETQSITNSTQTDFLHCKAAINHLQSRSVKGMPYSLKADRVESPKNGADFGFTNLVFITKKSAKLLWYFKVH